MADRLVESRIAVVAEISSEIEAMKLRERLAANRRHCRDLTSFDLVMLLVNGFILIGLAHALGWL